LRLRQQRGFASDNNSGAHVKVVEAIAAANSGHCIGYGDDSWTRACEEQFRRLFGADIHLFLTMGGTGANVVALQALLRSHEAVVCVDTAHINEDECGAPEKFTGSKLLPVPSADGKLRVANVEAFLASRGFEHHVQPRVISLTQSSELGTVYQPEEIQALVDFAHANGMYLHIDGARLANASASLNLPPAAFTTDLGVDVFSFGGTKNGMVLGEALIFSPTFDVEQIPYIRKQSMQLFSKMRFISAQFLAVLEDDLWLTMAEHANAMARKLAGRIAKFPFIEVTHAVEANAIFVRMPEIMIAPLQKEFFFYVWDERRSQVRWMTAFDTSEADIDAFVATIERLAEELI
jgi:threonine aldolase